MIDLFCNMNKLLSLIDKYYKNHQTKLLSMKKLFTLICVLTLTAAFGFSEVAAQPGFGLRGGLNIANLNNVDDADSRTGFMGGAYINVPVPMSPVSIQPELLYTQKGAEASETFGGETVTVTNKLDYVEIPVLAKFSFAPGPVTPHVYFGPYLAINVSAELEAEGGGQSSSEDIKDAVKDTDFGVVVGAEVDISKFNVGVRYGAGLTEIYEEGGDAKNGVLSIVAGINF